MKTDKNTIVGFVLLGILFFVYFWYTNKTQSAYLAEQKRIEDSVASVNAAKAKLLDTVAVKYDSLKRDSSVRVAAAGDFSTAAI